MNYVRSIVEEARELCEAATEGPWICGATDGVVTNDPRNYLICTHCTDDDKKFIARARTLVPELVELCEEQQQAYYQAYKDYAEDIARWKARAEEAERKAGQLALDNINHCERIKEMDKIIGEHRDRFEYARDKVEVLEGTIETLTADNDRLKSRAEETEAELSELQKAHVHLSDHARDLEKWWVEQKARAEEAERKVNALMEALKKHAACETCTGKKDCDSHGKAIACTLGGFAPDVWQFDYDRFKENGHERDI